MEGERQRNTTRSPRPQGHAVRHGDHAPPPDDTPGFRQESHQPHPPAEELARLQLGAPLHGWGPQPVGQRWDGGNDHADGDRIHEERDEGPGEHEKKKREKARQKHEKKGTKNGERPPGPKPHKAEQGEDGGTMRRWTTDKKNVSGKKRIFYCPSVHRRRWMKYHKGGNKPKKPVIGMCKILKRTKANRTCFPRNPIDERNRRGDP